jgi:hypothetical protein
MNLQILMGPIKLPDEEKETIERQRKEYEKKRRDEEKREEDERQSLDTPYKEQDWFP